MDESERVKLSRVEAAFERLDYPVAHDELHDHVDDMAAELAAKPRHALYAAKEALDAYYEAGGEGGFTVERRAWSGLFGTHDQREGMATFVEKREPEFG
jgi:enoyl-CoA hydratase/carnithine racemase